MSARIGVFGVEGDNPLTLNLGKQNAAAAADEAHQSKPVLSATAMERMTTAETRAAVRWPRLVKDACAPVSASVEEEFLLNFKI